MRKLPAAMENPLDNVLIDLADAMTPWLKRAGQTPNMLTGYSAASGAGAVWFLWHDALPAFTALWVMRLFWDTADGHFARAYGMETKLGDALDHATDTLCTLGLLGIIWKKYVVPPWIAITYVALFGVLAVHLGCQQRFVRGRARATESIDGLRAVCGSTTWMPVTRWLSHGTLHAFIIASVWYMDSHCRRESPPPLAL